MVVDERQLSRASVRLVVQMKRVSVGVTSGGFKQAVGIRSRSEWCRHSINKRELVGITG